MPTGPEPASWSAATNACVSKWSLCGRDSPSYRTADCGRASRALAAHVDRDVGSLARPDVDLARARDPEVGIAPQLHPLRDPARHAPDHEHHRERLGRNAERLVDDARIEVDIGIQLAAHEIVVLERDLL